MSTSERVTLLSWGIGASSIYGLYLAGKKDWRGWLLTFITEPFWGWFAILTHAWGTLVATFVYAAVALWNLWKWRKQPEPAAHG